jgi:hypothetical protein
MDPTQISSRVHDSKFSIAFVMGLTYSGNISPVVIQEAPSWIAGDVAGQNSSASRAEVFSEDGSSRCSVFTPGYVTAADLSAFTTPAPIARAQFKSPAEFRFDPPGRRPHGCCSIVMFTVAEFPVAAIASVLVATLAIVAGEKLTLPSTADTAFAVCVASSSCCAHRPCGGQGGAHAYIA